MLSLPYENSPAALCLSDFALIDVDPFMNVRISQVSFPPEHTAPELVVEKHKHAMWH